MSGFGSRYPKFKSAFKAIFWRYFKYVTIGYGALYIVAVAGPLYSAPQTIWDFRFLLFLAALFPNVVFISAALTITHIVIRWSRDFENAHLEAMDRELDP